VLNSFRHEEKGIEFVARAIRRDKGQMRADVSIRLRGRELDRDEFRFSDRGKRNPLAGTAFLAIDGAPCEIQKKEELQLLLRQFGDLVEEEWQQAIVVEDVKGLAEPESPPWVIRDYATEGAMTLLVGPPGIGKSWTGLLMAQSVACSVDTVFEVYEPQPVLYINLERSKRSLQNRLGMVNRVLGLPPTSEMPQINARGRSMGEITEAVMRHVEAEGTKFVVLDSLSRMGMGSMTQDDTANEMMDTLNALRTATVVLGHTPRPQGQGAAAQRQSEHVFGSQMITAAADFEVILKAKDGIGQTLIGMKVKKANDAPKAKLAGWLYQYGPAGLIAVSRSQYVSEEDFETED